MIVRIILVLFILLFSIVGINVIANAQSAIHEILGYMCLGFAGLYVGQLK